MTFLEWRRFNFFDLHRQVDGGKIAESLQDIVVTVATSGKSHVFLGDAVGFVHKISRSWEILSFKAYEATVTLAHQLRNDPFLITIGEDEAVVSPILKVWDWSRLDRHGNPTCVRATRVFPVHGNPVQATALAVHENKNLLAIGFADGSVCIHRGDVTRQRNSKINPMVDTSNSSVIDISFQGSHHIFVSTRASVGVWTVNGKKLEILDSSGGGPAVLSDNDYMVGKPSAIYCYSLEGRGPCYALEGEKKRLVWFRNYLVIITTDSSKNSPSTNNETPKKNLLTILDIQNKFIIFEMEFKEIIDAVLTEWGSFYILTRNKELLYLDEKDLKSKFNLLTSKNFYDVAIRIASSNKYDDDELMEIYKQYGDYLYDKGDAKAAIKQYVKTIGRLETSYVIRKFLDCKHMESLINYLQELHRKNLATEYHTILLMTCLIKLDQFDQQGKLKEFINTRDKSLNVDVDLAIKVCRQVSIDDALLLAYNNKKHDWYLSIIIEDKKDYKKAMDYIKTLEFEEADKNMRLYGNLLMQHLPQECTEFLKALFSSDEKIDESNCHVDQYLHLFLKNSRAMVDFLEHVMKSNRNCSVNVYNTLLEHSIHVWNELENDAEKMKQEEVVLDFLKNNKSKYDKDHALLLCQTLSFTPGALYLYEESEQWQLGLRMALSEGGLAAGRALCRRRAQAAPQLWLDLLTHPAPPEYLPEILNVVENEKLLSPMLTIEYLTSTTCTLGDVRKYLTKVFQQEHDSLKQDKGLCMKYEAESEENLALVSKLHKEAMTFQNSKCAVCHASLELPSVHFFCQHSFHQRCFDSYSLSSNQCPACNTTIEPPIDAPPERLHARLDTESDPFSVLSEYYGRGLFNKLTVVTDVGNAKSAPTPGRSDQSEDIRVPEKITTYGPGAEAKLRLGEGKSKQVYTPGPTSRTGVIPMPEGRMRVLEKTDATAFSSSLEASLNHKYIESVHKQERNTPSNIKNDKQPNIPRKSKSNQKISSSLEKSNMATGSKRAIGLNPFGEVDDAHYDDTKNPFADEKNDDPTNPFADDDDYDKNLNPFA